MCDQMKSKWTGEYFVNFNQDYTSIVIGGKNGYKLFGLNSVNSIDEVYCNGVESTRTAERLFNSSLVATVSTAEPQKLKVCHFKKGSEICNSSYPSDILAIKLNRSRLIVCLKERIYIHNIRDMTMLQTIDFVAPNEFGLCTLSLQSHLAYPMSLDYGHLQVYDAENLTNYTKIDAHASPLAAMNFSSTGLLIATASRKGTVIRVFCTKNGQKLHEFRRGVKRYAQIASMNFSNCASYVCVSSNTETIHIFKIDASVVIDQDNIHSDDEESHWSVGYLAKAVGSYMPNVTNVLCQERSFAYVQLKEAGLRYDCAITKIEKELRLIAACENGFMYVYDFDKVNGGECHLIRVHDLRNTLEGITELDLDANERVESPPVDPKPNTKTYASVLKGPDRQKMTDSDKFRQINDAMASPQKSIFDDVHFPPVSAVQN